MNFIRSTDKDSESSISRLGDSALVSSAFTNMSVVYTSKNGHTILYRAQRMGKWHLLKGLKKEYANDDFAISLLQKEFEIGYLLSHPNIAQTISLENVEGVGLCLVMEYVDGVTLCERLCHGTITATEACRLINQLIDATEYIHQKQIIHRDLKPENIMLTTNGGNIKVIDFGYSDADSYAVLKQPAGTRCYAAPEQMNGSAVDLRADIYAVGRIMLEMSALLPWTSRRRWRSIAWRCTQAAPGKRYATDAELRMALNHINRGWIIGVALLLLTTIIAATSFLSLGTTSGEQTAPTVVNKAPITRPLPQKTYTTTAQPASNKAPITTTITKTKPANLDSQIVYLTKYARRIALIDMEKAAAVERDTTIPITHRANESTYATLRLRDKVRQEVDRVIGKDSPDYPTALSTTTEALMETIRDFNKKRYYSKD